MAKSKKSGAQSKSKKPLPPKILKKPETAPARAQHNDNPEKTVSHHFPIVGIGASAGGLEAIKELLQALPVDTGMAFVLVQHLDPTHESLAPEILSRATRMPVHEIKDGMRVERNHVYMIPPNFDMALLHDVLSLLPLRTGNRGQHLARISHSKRKKPADFSV